MHLVNVYRSMALLGMSLLCRPCVLSHSAHVVAPRHALPAHATITGTVYVDVTTLRAVEVYASPAEVPAGFAGGWQR